MNSEFSLRKTKAPGEPLRGLRRAGPGGDGLGAGEEGLGAPKELSTPGRSMLGRTLVPVYQAVFGPDYQLY